MTHDDLTAKGFYQQPDGSWSKRPPVGAVAPSVSQQAPLRPLEQGVQVRQKGKGGVEVVVSLVGFRRKELDDDGFIYACKPLRDAIAATLGLDDGDRRIRFEYSQLETRGEQGVIVKVQKQAEK
jgi:hypothetical protein